MPRSQRSQQPPPRDARRFDHQEAAEAKDRLARRLAELSALDPNQPGFPSDAHVALDNARSTVSDVFGENSDEYQHFWAALIQVSNASGGNFFDENYDARWGEIRNAVAQADEAKRRLENLIRIVDEKTVAGASALGSRLPMSSRQVFLVHGHNEQVKQAVARLLERLDLEPIILHERPDMNRTIIEKFEAHVDVGFAVVLMTGDDRGGPTGTMTDSYQPRARQNVLLEMGFFLGRLGRARVCVLYEPGVEMPSDYSGILYKPLDSTDAWKLALAREIDAAGIPVDLNRLK